MSQCLAWLALGHHQGAVEDRGPGDSSGLIWHPVPGASLELKTRHPVSACSHRVAILSLSLFLAPSPAWVPR